MYTESEYPDGPENFTLSNRTSQSHDTFVY